MPSSFEPLFATLAPAAPQTAGESTAHTAPTWLAALAGLGAGQGVGFAADARFTPAVANAQPSETLHDGVELDAAYADGFAAGRAAVLAEMAEHEQARAGLTLALARLDEELGEQLAGRLAEVVAALCQATMAPYAIDPAALQRRCIAAAGMVGEGIIDASLRLHPDDIALLDRGFASTWHILPDAGLERGSVVFDMPEGSVEDGPAHWRAALAEALGTA